MTDILDPAERRAFLRRSILGQLAPEEQAELEEQSFVDSELFEELVATENDLIDAYARGDLSGADRLQFEARMLATEEQRERVKFSQSLIAYAPEPTSKRAGARNLAGMGGGLAPARRFALAGVVLGLAVFSVWISMSTLRLRRELFEAGQERTHLAQQQQQFQKQIAELSAQVQQLQSSSQEQRFSQLGLTGGPVVSVILSPGVSRSSSKQTILPISPGISAVLLLLKTGSTYSTFSVSLETPEGKQILKKDALRTLWMEGAAVVPVSLPSAALPHGDYVLRLMGNHARHSEYVDDYSFRIIRR